MKKSGSKKTFQNIVFMIITLALFFGVAELGLRVFDYSYQPSRNYMQFPWPDPRTMDRSMIEDPVLFWIMKPDTTWSRRGEVPITINSHGYRGEFLPVEKSMNEFRIASVGDSCTFGWNAFKPYPERLAAMLMKNETRVQYTSINFGTPGYTSYQGLKLMETKVFQYNPDVITVQFGWNDHWYSKYYEDKNQPTRDSVTVIARETLAKTRIFQGLNNVVDVSKKKFVLEQRPLMFRVSPVDYKNNLLKMVKLANEHEVPIVLVTPPSDVRNNSFTRDFWKTGVVEDIPTLKLRHNMYNRIIREIYRENDVILVDADALFRENLNTKFFDNPFRDPIHPNDTGHLFIANEIIRQLVAFDVIPKYKQDSILPLETATQSHALIQ